MTTRTTDDRQLDLMQLIDRLSSQAQHPEPGSMHVDMRLRGALSEAIRQSGMDRYEVAARVSRLLGDEVTKFQIDSWTAESKPDHRFPAAYLPAFCAAVGCWRPLAMLAEAGGKRVHSDPNIDIAAQIGQLEADIRKEEAELAKKRALLRQACATWTVRRGGGEP